MSPRPLDDTIAAIATAPGTAGLAVVRVSGPSAVTVAAAARPLRPQTAALAGHQAQTAGLTRPCLMPTS